MTREQIEAMLAGLDGVTPGPWSFEANYAIVHDSRVQTCCGRGHHECCGEPDISGDCFQVEFHNPVNAAHIARCDPDTMRAVLTLALEALELRAENERLREALKPFANAGWHATNGGTFRAPDPKQTDYNRARAALERKEK